MFTGLIEAQGRVRAMKRHADGARLELSAPFAAELSRGESVAVNGACLTAIDLAADWFSADVSTETLARTTLGELAAGEEVNLERSLAVGARLGGHFVLGHVDAVGKIRSVAPLGDARRIDVELPKELLPLVVAKGSIAIDGISLTVNEVDEAGFWVAVIPETQAKTNLGKARAGTKVNLEADVLGKYVLRALGTMEQAGGVTTALLEKAGYL